MVQSIIDDVKREFAQGNIITRLVIINGIVFIAINLVHLFISLSNAGEISPLYRDILHFFCVSSDFMHNLTHPWVFVTSIFLHEGFWHLLWNMLFLYWFGKIVADLIGDSKIFPLYLLGGLVGCLVFWASAQIMPYGGVRPIFALGASAGVMAIVMAAGMIAPEYNMRLLLIGDVKLKYVVAVLILLDLFGIGGNTNTGGHFAHLGGVFMGWFFVRQLQQGNDWSEGINGFTEKINQFFRDEPKSSRRKRDTKLVVKHSYKQKTEELSDYEVQEQVDRILDKIKEVGYPNLTQAEKDFLNNAGDDR